MTQTAAATAIGFKEWAFVCDALAQGVQTLVLRKGGIHEGRGGFEFKHREFFLFPTWFHTQGEKLRWLPEGAPCDFPPEEERQSVQIDGFARLEGVWRVTDWDKMEALKPLHIWNDDIVRERFVYDGESCLHVALLRTRRLAAPWIFPYQKSYGGCRSWVGLPDAGLGMIDAAVPAMSDEAWSASAEKVREVLGPE